MKCRCLWPSTWANWIALRCRLLLTTTSFASMRRCTRWLPMKPAPPVMQTRFPVRAMSLSVVTVSLVCAGASVLVLAKREQLLFGNPEAEQARDLCARSFQRRDDHEIVGDLFVFGDRMY